MHRALLLEYQDAFDQSFSLYEMHNTVIVFLGPDSWLKSLKIQKQFCTGGLHYKANDGA